VSISNYPQIRGACRSPPFPHHPSNSSAECTRTLLSFSDGLLCLQLWICRSRRGIALCQPAQYQQSRPAISPLRSQLPRLYRRRKRSTLSTLLAGSWFSAYWVWKHCRVRRWVRSPIGVCGSGESKARGATIH